MYTHIEMYINQCIHQHTATQYFLLLLLLPAAFSTTAVVFVFWAAFAHQLQHHQHQHLHHHPHPEHTLNFDPDDVEQKDQSPKGNNGMDPWYRGMPVARPADRFRSCRDKKSCTPLILLCIRF